MEQNSESWESWRLQGLGASDAPIVMGESKYLKPIDLFQIKLGLKEYKPNEFIVGLGHRFEPRARAHINLMNDFDFEPKIVEMAEYPWLRASLDGWDGTNPCELKYVGKKKIDAMRVGDYDNSHWIQMQHQMMVTGSEKCLYVCYTLDKEYRSIDEIDMVWIPYDREYVLDTLWPELYNFWECVKNKEWG